MSNTKHYDYKSTEELAKLRELTLKQEQILHWAMTGERYNEESPPEKKRSFDSSIEEDFGNVSEKLTTPTTQRKSLVIFDGTKDRPLSFHVKGNNAAAVLNERKSQQEGGLTTTNTNNTSTVHVAPKARWSCCF